MKYDTVTGAGRTIETVNHLNGLEKVCKNNTNSVADIDDSIIVKMPHIVSFNDSLIVIQMFQSIKSTAYNGGKITFGEGQKRMLMLFIQFFQNMQGLWQLQRMREDLK